jgi:hypothetical protein
MAERARAGEQCNPVRRARPGITPEAKSHPPTCCVQEILGHSTLAVTKRYTHVTSRLAKDAAERMARALWDEPDGDGL